MSQRGSRAFLLYINSCELERLHEVPIAAFYRQYGRRINLLRQGRRIFLPGLGWRICNGESIAYSLVFRWRFPKACDSGTFEDFHSEVTMWVIRECLRMGIYPPEIPAEVLCFDQNPSSRVQEYNMISNVSSVLTQLGLSLQEYRGFEPLAS